MKKVIENITGLNLSAENLHQYGSLNDIPEELIEQSRKLKTFQNIFFLRHFTNPDDYVYLNDFIAEVIEQNKSPSTWRTSVALSVEVSLKELLTVPAHKLIDCLGGAFTHVKSPDFFRWKNGVSVGNPTKYFPDFNYRKKVPDNAMRYDLNEINTTEISPEKATVFVTRWMAQRIARHVYSREGISFPISTVDLEDVISKNSWTPEALRALKGLNLEMEAGRVDDDTVPGYAGPDRFYMD